MIIQCYLIHFRGCNRGGFCNFMHLKKVSSSLKRKLEKGSEKVHRKKSVKLRRISGCDRRKVDGSLPKKYQDPYRYSFSFIS